MDKVTRNLLAISIVSLIVNAAAFVFIPDNIPVGMKNNIVTDYTSKSNFVLTNVLISVIILVASLVNYKFPTFYLSIFSIAIIAAVIIAIVNLLKMFKSIKEVV